MAVVATAFLAVAAVVFVGFLAGRLFERTRFPDAPILLALGLIVGPINRLGVDAGWGSATLADALDPGRLRSIVPLIAALALVVLMFDSGMELDFGAFRRSLGPAAQHTFPIFLMTIAGVSLVGVLLLGMPVLVAVVLGVALVNVDQAVSAGVLRQLSLAADLRAIYFIEMALYDLLSIPLMISLLQFAQGIEGGGAPLEILGGFARMASASVFVGLAAGVPWLYALRSLKGHPNSYMLTFATTLGVYGLSEVLGGSGALSILIFGLLVGNREHLLKRFAHMKDVGYEHEKVQKFHDEIAFLVRTLFFLYLGAMFWVGPDVRWPVPVPFLGDGPWLLVPAALLILAALVVARYAPVRMMARDDDDRRGLFPVFGRGLDTAVLATLPFLVASYVPGTAYYDLFSPWEPLFLNLALLLILLTVLASGLFVFREARRADRAARAAILERRAKTARRDSLP